MGDFDQFNCVQPTLLDCHVQSNEPTWRAPRMSQKKGHSDDLDNEEFTEALLAVRTHEIRQAASDIRSGITEQVQTANEKAAKSEHTSFVVRGMLGAQERKRRKIDVDEIRRLRIHVSILTRQAKDKDNLIGNT